MCNIEYSLKGEVMCSGVYLYALEVSHERLYLENELGPLKGGVGVWMLN